MTKEIRAIHEATIKKYGEEAMLMKFIQELFEIKVVMSTPEINHFDLEEEIADVLNMTDKLWIAGYDFDFASDDSIQESIDDALDTLSNGEFHIHCSPKVLMETLIFEYKLDREHIKEEQIKKMHRTKERMEKCS